MNINTDATVKVLMHRGKGIVPSVIGEEIAIYQKSARRGKLSVKKSWQDLGVIYLGS